MFVAKRKTLISFVYIFKSRFPMKLEKLAGDQFDKDY